MTETKRRGRAWQAGPVVLSRPNGLSLTLIPAHGGRIAQITDARGNNWLADTGAAELPADAPVEFSGGTRGGWDECLPSVSDCTDPNRPGIEIADHGDFWATPWAVDDLDEHCVSLVSEVPGHPLQVRKTVALPAEYESMYVEIEIRNRTDLPYRYLYSAHPLWAFEHDISIDLPGAGRMRTAFGPGWLEPVRGKWPLLPSPDSAPQDMSQIARHGDRSNYKVFVRWSGRAQYRVKALDSALRLRQSPEVNPWLGLCVNRGAYPHAAAAEHWIALEPTTAPTDSLAVAVQSGSAQKLGAAGTVRWSTQIQIVHGAPVRP